jgi:3'-phosphoadenosine 5'-phosphosulfate sulfotransferase (PAPS reductase)/FAD synthetase
VSGGKDSTAAGLYLREQGIPFRAVFFDTGWEHPDTYRYLREVVPDVLGVEVEWHRRLPELSPRLDALAATLEDALALAVGPWGDRRSAMVRWCIKKGMFPSRVARWCTSELKYHCAVAVMRAAHAAGELPVNVVGVRAEESVARRDLPEREIDADLDAAVWRPLIAWTTADVIAIHQRHDVRPNPLYLRAEGARRVGCWPCIQCGKAELRLLARDDHRVRALEALEFVVGWLASERYAERGDVMVRPPAFFQGRSDAVATWCGRCRGSGQRDDAPCTRCDGVGSRMEIPTIPIRTRLEWAQTDRGGDQMMLDLPSDSGCMRWGMCDLPDGALVERAS